MTLDANDIMRECGTEHLRAAIDTGILISEERHSENVPSEPISSSSFKDFVFDGDIRVKPQPQIIKALCPRQGTGFLGGQSGAGKSSVAIDLGIAIASGGEFFERQVREPVGVVYLAAEGGGGIDVRILAAKRKRDITAILPLTYSSVIPDLTDYDEVGRLIEKLKLVSVYFKDWFGIPLGVVIIDTIAAAFDLQNENGNSEAARCCRQLQRISRALGAFVLGVHHYGKAQEAGLRGGSAWRAGVDVVLAVLADRDETTGNTKNRRLVLTKNRDGLEGPIGGFDLLFIELDRDDDGDPVGASAVEPSGNVPAVRTQFKKEAIADQAFRLSFDACLLSSGTEHAVKGNGPIVTAVPLESVREEFYRRYPSGKRDPKKAADAKRAAFNRALKKCLDSWTYTTEAIGESELVWKQANLANVPN
jgi:hypothetical protein